MSTDSGASGRNETSFETGTGRLIAAKALDSLRLRWRPAHLEHIAQSKLERTELAYLYPALIDQLLVPASLAALWPHRGPTGAWNCLP